jgi:hypothetical protein
VKIATYYSHLNGLEYLLVHKKHLWEEIQSVLGSLDADKYKTKISKEKRRKGKLLYAPTDMNQAIRRTFNELGWNERRVSYFVTDDPGLTRKIQLLDRAMQREAIRAAGKLPFPSYNQTDFVKERCMVEIQFGKYAFIAHDLFVKHMSFYTTDHMDVGIEVLPTKAMQTEMSSGVPYYEGALNDLIRQGKGVPHVPLVLVGVEPDRALDATALAQEVEEEAEQIELGILPDPER